MHTRGEEKHHSAIGMFFGAALGPLHTSGFALLRAAKISAVQRARARTSKAHQQNDETRRACARAHGRRSHLISGSHTAQEMRAHLVIISRRRARARPIGLALAATDKPPSSVEWAPSKDITVRTRLFVCLLCVWLALCLLRTRAASFRRDRCRIARRTREFRSAARTTCITNSNGLCLFARVRARF